jgi:NAD(P)-dependent dehydrogenase (short-subunit alcohol dehydrogenase family)
MENSKNLAGSNNVGSGLPCNLIVQVKSATIPSHYPSMSDSPSSPHPKIALVTGAGKRLGSTIARQLAARGWGIAVHYRHSAFEAQELVEQLRSEHGSQAFAFQADLADAAQTAALVPTVIRHFGRLDAVVNNASIFEYDTASSFSFELALKQFAANTAAPVLLARDLAAHLAAVGEATGSASRTGVVINLLDQKLWNMNPDFFSYTLTKAALQAATDMLAQGLAPLVRVNAVAPGLTLPSHLQDAAAFARTAKLTLTGHANRPEDVAAAIVFLIETPSANGTIMQLDSGQHLVPLARDVSFL